MGVPIATLIEFGIFEMTSGRKIYSEHSATGYKFTDTELSLLKSTQKIPLKPGLCFGIKYNLANFSNDLFTCTIYHPEIENPEGLTFTQTTIEKKYSPTVTYFDFILFEYKWQMLPGYWTFQISDHHNVIFEKEFEIFIENSIEVEKDEDYFYDL